VVWERERGSGESGMRSWSSLGLAFAFGLLKSMRKVGSGLLVILPSTSL
jgi:hypothetical protein